MGFVLGRKPEHQTFCFSVLVASVVADRSAMHDCCYVLLNSYHVRRYMQVSPRDAAKRIVMGA